MSIIIGKIQKLFVQRFTQNGAYLSDIPLGFEAHSHLENYPESRLYSHPSSLQLKEVLLPNKFVSEEFQIGDEIEVFVLTDSQDRPVATTQIPKAQCGEIAVLDVVSIESQGCFLDLGLDKHIFMPSKSPQRFKLQQRVVVVIMLDKQSRLIAKLGIKSHLTTLNQDGLVGRSLKPPAQYSVCRALVFEKTPLGFGCILASTQPTQALRVTSIFSQSGFYGLLYATELPKGLSVYPGLELDVKVKKVRSDVKLDLCLVSNPNDQKQKLLDSMPLSLHFSSSPESIFESLQMSKNLFKRLINELTREGKVKFNPEKNVFQRTF